MGIGADDKGTIPSVFAENISGKVINYAETGYMARQSLAMLTNEYLSAKHTEKRAVVFYDGVNDVSFRCRADIKGLESARENRIRGAIAKANPEYHRFSLHATFAQLRTYFAAILRRLSKEEQGRSNIYDCDVDKVKANFIAESLVSTWKLAQTIAAAKGDQFVAVLQPVAFLGQPNISHLNLDSERSKAKSKQFQVLYPLIRKKARESEVNFLDLTGVLDFPDYFYVDFCHVSPNANHQIANALVQYFKQLNSGKGET